MRLGSEFFCPCCGTGRLAEWDDAAIGQELRRRRMAKGVSMDKLGAEAAWVGTSIFYWEKGRGRFTPEIVRLYLEGLDRVEPGRALSVARPRRRLLRELARKSPTREVSVDQGGRFFEELGPRWARHRASDTLRRDPAFEQVRRGVYRLRAGV